jgi:hypothetical protein
MNNHLESDGT